MLAITLAGATAALPVVSAEKDKLRLFVANTADETGVFESLLADFHQRHPQIEVAITTAGALEVLDRAAQGMADLVITHVPAAEKLFIEEGYGLDRFMVMYDEFAVYGPADHPLTRQLQNERDIRKALTALARDEAPFIVPSPRSGTHAKLAELWAMAGVSPSWVGYETIHASASTTLDAAASQSAFTFADVATFLSQVDKLRVRMVPVVRDHIALRNYYSVILLNDAKLTGVKQKEARILRDYLISDAGQARIASFNNRYEVNLLMPAAHLDPALQVRRAEDAAHRKALMVQLTTALAVVLSAFLVTAAVLWRRAARLEKVRRISEERYSLAIAGANDGIWDWDIEQQQVYASPRLLAQLGIAHPPGDARDPVAVFGCAMEEDDQHAMRAQLEAHLASAADTPFVAEFQLRRKDGQPPLWMMVRGRALYDSAGRPTRMSGSMTEVTNDKLKAVFEYRALHDPLTGLANRALLDDRLEQTLFGIERSKQRCTLMMIDLDKFKHINDTHGHQAGDVVLREVAARLRKALRRTDTVARFGGDEFFAILPGTDAEVATGIARKLVDELRRPIALAGQTLTVGASVGLVVAPDHGRSLAELLGKADKAMYEAKSTGRGLSWYSPQNQGGQSS